MYNNNSRLPCRCAKMKSRVNMQWGRFVRFNTQVPDKCSMSYEYKNNCKYTFRHKTKLCSKTHTTAQVHQVGNVEIFVINHCSMNSRTRSMINAEVVQVRIPTEQVAFLFVDHQFLNEFIVFGDVQMMSGRSSSCPKM